MTSMFTNKSVEFHTAESDIYNKLCAEFPDAELEGKNFGVLNVTANKVLSSLHWIFPLLWVNIVVTEKRKLIL